jgi:acetyl esterase/lipase
MAVLFLTAGPLRAQEPADYTRVRDVIYGRKHGTALTMDVFTPKAANGAAVVFMVSGGWFSSHEAISDDRVSGFLARGYTVFAVVHGSQPKYTIPEIINDIHRSVRFIRHQARDYGIDPDRIGITGGSAGGHLSLMMGMAGGKGDPEARDPVDQASSAVQAVACFFPPTDFLNYGEPGRTVFDALDEELAAFRAPFDFQELDTESRRFVPITDEARRLQIAREISPITHVSPRSAPTLIIHGDRDRPVPIQQAQVLQEACEAAGVPFKLVVRRGAGHGWENILDDVAILADWFDLHLKEGP